MGLSPRNCNMVIDRLGLAHLRGRRVGGEGGGHEIYIASAKRGPKIARRNYLLSAYVSSSLEQLYSNSISIRYVMNDCLILVAVNT